MSPIVAAPIVVIMMLITPTFIVNKIWFGLAVNSCVFFFVLHMYLTTRYTITKEMLTITSGFLFKKEIALNSITSISPSRNPISSPAFSLDRLQIRHGKNDSVLISPINKEEFLRDIHAASNTIVIEPEKKKQVQNNR